MAPLATVLAQINYHLFFGMDNATLILLWLQLPFWSFHLILLGAVATRRSASQKNRYRASIRTTGGPLVLENIRRGVSVIGAAGSGKTESVVAAFLEHFAKHGFSGVIHDYKDFEIAGMAYPLFDGKGIPFYLVSFGPFHDRINPIAPAYLPNEESVHAMARVLMDNLLEREDGQRSGAARFFDDAVEGLLAGIIWRLRTDFPGFCSLPHLMALYQTLDLEALARFLSDDIVSKAMADAFLSSVPSPRQLAGIRATLSNALKKIATKGIFWTLGYDGVPLDINQKSSPAILCLVNHPRNGTSLSPVISAVIHSTIQCMSLVGQRPSFLLMEEAPTIRLPEMHRIPATLRGYDILTLYVMQDKIQNDIVYGEKKARAILANLSYQFFGKANDPDTAKYYERFFEPIKKRTTTISRGIGLGFDTRISKGEKEVAKMRADAFFRLDQGEFVVFHDGKDRKVRFKAPRLGKRLPRPKKIGAMELERNFRRIHKEVRDHFSRLYPPSPPGYKG
ncbi:mobilization protein [Sediminicola luteus]|uniref:Mobilization protein n=2 Tax=Sediminicola luteus TaxID=319238 RepID=A0A2A4G5A5_9FLAO|nr:mobilization protein [Sediminicola luteus]